jgi:hypothetical protein
MKNYKLCDMKIAKSLFLSERNKAKPRNIGFTKIDKNQYILKTEDVEESLSDMHEYVFYEKVSKKIYKNKFEFNLQVPIEYKVCDKAQNRRNPTKYKKQIYYLFHVLKGDLTYNFFRSISSEQVINMFQQYLLSLYFLNHKLNYYHNDFYTNYKILYNKSLFNINNLMYMKNPTYGKTKNNTLKVDDFTLEIGKYRAMIIDFGLVSKFPKHSGYKLKMFYISLSIRLFYYFRYYSEVFLLFILLYHTYFGDFRLYHIKNFYQYFESKMYHEKTLIEFDRCVYKYFIHLLDKNELKLVKKKIYISSTSK